MGAPPVEIETEDQNKFLRDITPYYNLVTIEQKDELPLSSASGMDTVLEFFFLKW